MCVLAREVTYARAELDYCRANADAAHEGGDFADQCYWGDRCGDAVTEVTALEMRLAAQTLALEACA